MALLHYGSYSHMLCFNFNPVDLAHFIHSYGSLQPHIEPM